MASQRDLIDRLSRSDYTFSVKVKISNASADRDACEASPSRKVLLMTPVFRINRRTEPGQYRLVDLFPDIRTYDVLSAIFADADEIDLILTQTQVFLTDQSRSICVGNDDGSVTIGLAYLHKQPDEILYLDIIHELCHVKQHMQGRDLYDKSKAYVDRETEVEAYDLTVREARRIGLTDQAIHDYLCVPWITPEEHLRLSRRLGVVEGPPAKGRPTERGRHSP
jgi:hypothetical protein